MNSAKNYVIALLAVTTVGGSLLAWRQYGELVEMRAAAMNRDERADLQKRVWDLEKRNRELQDQLAVVRALPGEGEPAGAVTEGERGSGERGNRMEGRGRGDPRDRGAVALQQANAIRELMNKPEVQAMLGVQQRAAIEQRYATLFKNLNLPSDQIDKLTALLAERSTTMQDVMAAARDQGINPRENPGAFRKMIADAQNQVNQGIKATIGEAGFAQLTNYEQTLPQRNVVNDLQQRLSYTNAPLTPAQSEQLVQILATNAPARQDRPANAASPPPPGEPGGGRGGVGPPGGFGGRGGPDVGGLVAGLFAGGPGLGAFVGGGPPDGGRGGTAPVTPAAVAQAQTILTPPQVAALQQIQQQQQAQQQLRQLVNDTLATNPPPPLPGRGDGSSTPPPPRKRPGGE